MKKIAMTITIILAFLTASAIAQQNEEEILNQLKKTVITKKDVNLFLKMPEIVKQLDDNMSDDKIDSLLRKKYKIGLLEFSTVIFKITYILNYMYEGFSDSEILEETKEPDYPITISASEIKLIRDNYDKLSAVMEELSTLE